MVDEPNDTCTDVVNSSINPVPFPQLKHGSGVRTFQQDVTKKTTKKKNNFINDNWTEIKNYVWEWTQGYKKWEMLKYIKE